MNRQGKVAIPHSVYCPTCRCMGFLKSNSGSVVTLDCGHTVSAGVLLSKARRRSEFEGAPAAVDGGTARRERETATTPAWSSKGLTDEQRKQRKRDRAAARKARRAAAEGPSPLQDTGAISDAARNMLRRKK